MPPVGCIQGWTLEGTELYISVTPATEGLGDEVRLLSIFSKAEVDDAIVWEEGFRLVLNGRYIGAWREVWSILVTRDYQRCTVWG